MSFPGLIFFQLWHCSQMIPHENPLDDVVQSDTFLESISAPLIPYFESRQVICWLWSVSLVVRISIGRDMKNQGLLILSCLKSIAVRL